MPHTSKRLLTSLSLLLFILLGAPRSWTEQATAITLSVDASEAPRRIFHARLVIPAQPGPLTLRYPKWIPGEHGPTGPITNLTGLKFSAAGKPVAWRRDDVDMYAFRLEIPAGATALEAELDYVSPTAGGIFTSGPIATAQLFVLNWNLVLLYPEGRAADELTYVASLTVPQGWQGITALTSARQSGSTMEYAPVSLTALVDAPVLMGAHFRIYKLLVEGAPEHQLALAADSEAALELSPERRQHFTNLVAEARALFGAHHYRRYTFLWALSDHVEPFGLEHHESSDNRTPERVLLDADLFKLWAGLLPHEFVHSWNAKYRRPAGLTTRDFHTPMKGELLWVYEGLTTYLGEILTARSGLYSPEEFRENAARVAAYLDNRPGRTWRPLADTAIAAQTLYGAAEQWAAWRRGVDFYDESFLIWLEADVLIRQQTQGRRSLDDFCRLFHGGESGPPEVKPYTFDELFAALNQIAPYDWRRFFTERLNSTSPPAPLGGLEASGWRLVFTDQPNDLLRAAEEKTHVVDLSYSLGLTLRREEGTPEDGMIVDVIPDSPAARAGLGPGMKLVAANGRAWSPEILREAVRAAKGATVPIELLVANAEFYKTYALDYHDGERYPHLVRDTARPDLLGEIIKPRAR